MLPLLLCWLTAPLADDVVFDRTGRYGRVQVHLAPDDRRTLTIDGSLQSSWQPAETTFEYGYLHAAAVAVRLAETPPERALVIGLGGGTFSRWLRGRDVDVRAIEIDPVVVRAARRWFGLPREMRIVVGDGRRVLERDHRTYDLIVIDAASEAGVPPHLLTIEFLQVVRDHLSDHGIAMANSWSRAKTAREEASGWAEIFGDVWAIRVPRDHEENRVLVAGPGLGPATPPPPATRTRPAHDALPLRDCNDL